MASGGHASSASFLSWYWYMGSWPPFQEGWGSTACVCMCACAVMAQWEVDDECFWLDNWFAPVFTFNLWWAWSVEGSQSGTVGFNRKRLNGLSKSHIKLCHSLTNAYWEFPLLSSALWFDTEKKRLHTFTVQKPLTECAEIHIYVTQITDCMRYSVYYLYQRLISANYSLNPTENIILPATVKA